MAFDINMIKKVYQKYPKAVEAARKAITATGARANGFTVVGPAVVSNAAAMGFASVNARSFGYFAGGYNPSPPNFSIVDRIDYSNDTATAAVKGPLSAAKRGVAATGNASFGYFGGGRSPDNATTVDRIDYSNDTATASSKGPLSAARRYLSACSAAANALPTNTGIIETFIESTDPRDNVVPQGTDFGYFGGGEPGPKSTVDRVDYSNDTATASPKGPLSSARSDSAATGNASFGYFGGGYNNPNYYSTVDRVDYSNDTATAAVKGPLSLGKSILAATGNADFGYFGGGSPGTISTVQRIDYSNDTATALVRGILSVNVQSLAATGNASFGYFGGGDTGPKTTVSRVDYSNDTATAVAKGPLSAARYNLAATGSSSFGYFGGGQSPLRRHRRHPHFIWLVVREMLARDRHPPRHNPPSDWWWLQPRLGHKGVQTLRAHKAKTFFTKSNLTQLHPATPNPPKWWLQSPRGAQGVTPRPLSGW